MSSRDYGFLTLRNITAYQQNGLPVPPNYVLVTSSNAGVGVFSNAITISSISVSSLSASSLSVSTLTAKNGFINTLSTQAEYASSINATSILVSNLQASTTSTPTIFSNNIFNTQTVNTNVLNANTVSSNIITTNYLSTLGHISLLDSNLSTLELTSYNSTLYVDGHPVVTEANISTVSTVFWDDLAGQGSIFNKNVGIGAQKYLVGVGTASNPLNATFDVLYAGGSNAGNVINVSTANNNRLTMDSNGVVFITSSLSTNTINMKNGYINSQNGLVLNGSVSISNSIDGVANLSLFNNKAFLTTNDPFDGCYLELNNSGPNFYVGANGNNPNYALIGSTITRFSQNINKGVATLEIQNLGAQSTACAVAMITTNGSYAMYTSQAEATNSGLTPSTFQIYSYYPNANPVLTIYPNGNMVVPGNLNVSGSAISKVVTTSIPSNPGSGGWLNYYGKYCFVNGDSIGTLTLPTGGDVSASTDGTVLVIRNIGVTTSITVNNSIGSGSILPGKTTSYVYTTAVTSGWYAL